MFSFTFIVKNSKVHVHICSCLRTVKSVLVLEANNTQSYFILFMNSVHLHNTHFSTSCFLPTTAAGAAVANITSTSLPYTFLVNLSLVSSLKFCVYKCILFSGLL